MSMCLAKPLLLALALLAAPVLLAQTASEELMKAIYAGKAKQAAALLQAGADPDTRDEMAQPAISAAAYMGQEASVRLLLARRADFRAEDQDGFNALHAAAMTGRTRIVQLLLESGLDVNQRGRQSRRLGRQQPLVACGNARARRGYRPVTGTQRRSEPDLGPRLDTTHGRCLERPDRLHPPVAHARRRCGPAQPPTPVRAEFGAVRGPQGRCQVAGSEAANRPNLGSANLING